MTPLLARAPDEVREVREMARMPGTEAVWELLKAIPDPEIPAVSIVDLGIVRDVTWERPVCVVTVTPTYSGCPAIRAIEAAIRETLAGHGLASAVRTRLAPAWTTDWLSDTGRARLQASGIAAPVGRAVDVSGLKAPRAVAVACPRCASRDTRLLAAFGSTACKALYRCNGCLETFDYFKPH